MFQRGIAILLIGCTLTANFAKLFVFAGFELNQKYIAANLCQNRNKPWMHCNGHCYLMKKIKLAEDKEKNDERQAQKNLFQEAIWSSVKKITFPSSLLQVFPERYQPMIPQSVTLHLFRPPQVLA